MDISPAIFEAFTSFKRNPSQFAVPLAVSGTTFEALSSISYPDEPRYTYQQALNRLDTVLNPRRSLFIILRRNDSLVAVTYLPYLADPKSRKLLLDSRDTLLRQLGEENFFASIICKEVGEIADARSWNERDGEGQPWSVEEHETSSCDIGESAETARTASKDLGYQKNKCRLCDRRMKNSIDDNALEALGTLSEAGDCVQISVNIKTEVLRLNFQRKNFTTAQVAPSLPIDTPSFTFYRHHSNGQLFFIFCSPDNATVQERMKHTLAIPGLINIIVQDNSVEIDQKIEIHDPEDLDFAERDQRIGKFRSMYLRNDKAGTESVWEGMGEYQKVLDAVR